MIRAPDVDALLREAKATVADLEIADRYATAARLLTTSDGRMTPILLIQGNRVSVFWPSPTTEQAKIESAPLADELRAVAIRALTAEAWAHASGMPADGERS